MCARRPSGSSHSSGEFHSCLSLVLDPFHFQPFVTSRGRKNKSGFVKEKAIFPLRPTRVLLQMVEELMIAA